MTDIIHTLTRAKAFPILQAMVKAIDPDLKVATVAEGNLKSSRDFDNVVDYCFEEVSDAKDNRWSGVSHGDGGGTKLDSPTDSKDKTSAKQYGNKLVGAVRAAYKAKGEKIPTGVEVMLAEIAKTISKW